MASNMKEIKSRINSIINSKQITNAMNIVSTTKFKKYQVLAYKTREYEKALEMILNNILMCVGQRHNVLFEGKKEVKSVGIIVMGSDRGLCGSFNSNTIKKMEELIKKFKKEGKKVSIISIGRKIKEYCNSRNVDVDSEFIQLIPELMFEKARIISEDIVDFYLNNQYDEVYMIYSTFVSVISYNLTVEKLLPFNKVMKENNEKNQQCIYLNQMKIMY